MKRTRDKTHIQNWKTFCIKKMLGLLMMAHHDVTEDALSQSSSEPMLHDRVALPFFCNAKNPTNFFFGNLFETSKRQCRLTRREFLSFARWKFFFMLSEMMKLCFVLFSFQLCSFLMMYKSFYHLEIYKIFPPYWKFFVFPIFKFSRSM